MPPFLRTALPALAALTIAVAVAVGAGTGAPTLDARAAMDASAARGDRLPVGVGMLGMEDGFIQAFERGDSLSVGLYADTAAATPDRHLTVYWEPKLTAPYVRDLTAGTWLKPEVDAFTYGEFYLRVVDQAGAWAEVVVNNETGTTYWLRPHSPWTVTPWPEF